MSSPPECVGEKPQDTLHKGREDREICQPLLAFGPSLLRNHAPIRLSLLSDVERGVVVQLSGSGMLRWPLVPGLRARVKERMTSVKAKVKNQKG